jgi:hypothetical protein
VNALNLISVISCLHNSFRSAFIALDARSYIKNCEEAAYRQNDGLGSLIGPINQCLDRMGYGLTFDLKLVDQFGLGIEPVIHRLAVLMLREHKRTSQCRRNEGLLTASWDFLVDSSDQACPCCPTIIDLTFSSEGDAECRSLLARFGYNQSTR